MGTLVINKGMRTVRAPTDPPAGAEAHVRIKNAFVFIVQPEDWYSVKMSDLKDVENFPSQLSLQGELAKLLMLQQRYPDH